MTKVWTFIKVVGGILSDVVVSRSEETARILERQFLNEHDLKDWEDYHDNAGELDEDYWIEEYEVCD